MIVCSCNVFTDHDVRHAVSTAPLPPRTAGQVYGCLGCSAQCGRCARTIKKIMDEALGTCAKACCSGCPHSAAAHDHAHSHAEPHMPVMMVGIEAARLRPALLLNVRYPDTRPLVADVKAGVVLS